MTADAVGGVWTYALDLSLGLARNGIAVTLAVLGPALTATQRMDAMAVPGLRVVETGAELDWLAPDEAAVRRAATAAAALARSERADLVHLNTPALAIAAFDVPVVGVCHSCLRTWWQAMRDNEPLPVDFAWRTVLLAQGYAGCDTLIAPTRAFARATAAAYDIAQPIVVHNGCGSLPAPATARDVVLAAGRLWDAAKNMGVLDRAAATIDAPVVAAGPLAGPAGDRIDLAHARTPGAQDRRQMAAWYARARVFVSVARYEPFGLAVLEAAQAGSALVLSDRPGFRELWDGAALFVDPLSPEAVAAAANQLLHDRDAREALAAASRRRAESYTVHAMTAGTIAAYRALARAPVGEPA